MRPVYLRTVVALVVAGVGVDAAAGPIVSARLDGALLIEEYAREEVVRETDPGYGISGSLGYRLDLAGVAVTPDIGASFARFTDPYEREALRLFGGGALSLPWLVAPSLSAHVGWGRADGVDDDAVLSRHGVTLDVGAGADVWLAPSWSIGVHATYNELIAETGSGAETSRWVTLGLRTALAL